MAIVPDDPNGCCAKKDYMAVEDALEFRFVPMTIKRLSVLCSWDCWPVFSMRCDFAIYHQVSTSHFILPADMFLSVVPG